MARLLIVDDSKFQRLQVTEILQGAGYEVLEAGGGQEGIDLAVRDRPDCIVLDLLMPDVDGLEVLKRLGEIKLEIPVIVLTADIQETTHQMSLELGAREILGKPPQADALVAAIERALGA